MTSTVEPTVTQQMHNSHLGFEKVSPTRKPGATNATTFGGTPWAGLPTIWHNTLQSHHLGRLEPGLPASPTRSDSLTPTKTTHTSPFPEPRDSLPFAPSKPFRPTLSSLPSGPSAVARTSAQVPSAQVKRSLGPSDVNIDNIMPHLGTAALLNGSAPDVDLASANSYHPAALNENRLRALNIGTVHEFVPAQPQTFIGTQWFGSRYGDDGHSTSTSRPTTGFNANSQSFIPTYRNFGGPFSQSQNRAEQSNPIMQLSQLTTRSDETTSPIHRVNLSQSFPTFLGHDPNQFSSSLSNLHISDNANLRPPFLYDEGSQMRMAPTAVNAGETRNGIARNTQPLTDQTCISAVSQSNKATASSFESGIYTPSCTPPTASGSRRSNSGSGTSTRASSQSVDTRVGGFDTQTHQARYVMYQNQLPTPGLEYLSLPALPNGCIAPTPQMVESQQHSSGQGQYAPPYNQHHQHHASQGRMEQEREQNLSPLMKEFRANHKTKRYELKDAYGHIVEFSGDQHGSRFIQLKLETANSDEKERVFNEIQENALQLMTDIFGNYVIQKLFEHGTQNQKKILSSQMKGRIYYLTTQVYGCRVVQKALEHVLTDQQASMVKELEGNVLNIIENQNGNHVIQKAIEWVPGEYIQFVYEAAQGQVVRLSKHNYGCRVIQRMLEHGNSTRKRSILNELHEAVPNLIEDQFGNYVMQHIIQHGESVERQMVVNTVQQHLVHYSKHKFASNVVEIAIETAEEHQRQDFLRNLTTGIDAQGQPQVYGLIRDQYGNYVIQKVLTKLQGTVLKDLIDEIQHHLITLRKISHGKQVSAMEKAIAEASTKLGPQLGSHVSAIPLSQKAGIHPMPHQTGEFQSRYAQLYPPQAHRQRLYDRAY